MKHLVSNSKLWVTLKIGWISIALNLSSCQQNSAPPPYQDTSHFSKVFNRDKYYRLYLPDTYNNSQERYPVIYFFHGWGGRYKSDDNAKLAYEEITELVNKYRVILVMWDGNIEESEPRPYNVGNHSDVKYDIQMKDYFTELISHIDSDYRTIPDKKNRGIIGFSMGGFMAYFLAGKYPDKVAAAVSMTGSPEFFVGYPDNHTLYPLRYMFKNLREVKLRFHNSTADELTYLNTEVHNGAQWEGDLDYEYWQFAGGHVVDQPGETKVFEKAMNFVVNAFKNPIPKPSTWSHYDIYPEFEVYDYLVKTNKQEPGFVYLGGVSKSGFGTSTHKWAPGGPPLSQCNIELITAPLYQPNTTFNIVRYAGNQEQVIEGTSQSDGSGRLHFKLDEKDNEIGIYSAEDVPELISFGYTVDKDKKFLRSSTENKLRLKLFNRGGQLNANQSIKVSISTNDASLTIIDGSISVTVNPETRVFITPEFRIVSNKKPPHDGSPSETKLKVRIKLDDKIFDDELTIPVLFDVPSFTSLDIDDGRATSDSVAAFGKGNGDGKASAGEQVMVYTNGHKLRLYTDDPYIHNEMETLVDEVLPAKWPDGITQSSVIKISDDCPTGHVFECIGGYETKGFMPIERKVTWGKVKITVTK